MYREFQESDEQISPHNCYQYWQKKKRETFPKFTTYFCQPFVSNLAYKWVDIKGQMDFRHITMLTLSSYFFHHPLPLPQSQITFMICMYWCKTFTMTPPSANSGGVHTYTTPLPPFGLLP